MCDRYPAANRCGRTPNFCLRGRCGDCADPLLRMDVRQAVIDHLGGLDLAWRRPVRHPQPADPPDHLRVLVQAYADAVDVPWVALHGGRVFGAAGPSMLATADGALAVAIVRLPPLLGI